ncbi:MAG: hypothetical protein AAGF89_06800 [Bacteroidota bacterium]
MVSNNRLTDDIQQLSIITVALMIGLVLFAGVVYYLISSAEAVPGTFIDEQLDLPLVGGFALICITMSRFLSNKLIDQVPRERKQDYNAAFGHYRSAVILRLALLEGPGLFACVIAMVTNNHLFLFVTLFLLAMMWLSRPTATEFRERFDVRV